ncbi:MAG: hypothetical protein ACI4DU_10620 [Lachnospiraceae bacterium]
MEPIALFNNGNIIYWNTIIIGLGIIAGCFVTWALYLGRNRFGTVIYVYLPLAIAGSVYLSRIFHWYCNQEQYESFSTALANLGKGSFLIPGIIFACWLLALLMQCAHLVKSRFDILDPLAPGLALTLALIKFSDIFTDACRGKQSVETLFLQRLPFSVLTMDSAGNMQYRMATFFLTFLLLLLIVVLLLIFYVFDRSALPVKNATGRKTQVDAGASETQVDAVAREMQVDAGKTVGICSGNTWRMFLVWYGAVEIAMDSTRYDASHLYFPGEALAGLNKAAGFMGLSQLLGAIFCIYGIIYFTVQMRKNKMNVADDVDKVGNAGKSDDADKVGNAGKSGDADKAGNAGKSGDADKVGNAGKSGDEDKTGAAEPHKKKTARVWQIIIWAVFVISLGVAGVSEYLVQRHSSQFLLYFSLQFTASLLMGGCVFGMYRLGCYKNNQI